MTPQTRVVQINISDGGVPKRPIAEAAVGPLGVRGDRQANTQHHGGPERALCLFSLERLEALRAEGHPIGPGDVGENITITGLDWDQIVPGRQIRLGDDVVIEITGYAQPCSKISANFHDRDSNRINQETNPGWSRTYARVIVDGTLRAGDGVALLIDTSARAG